LCLDGREKTSNFCVVSSNLLESSYTEIDNSNIDSLALLNLEKPNMVGQFQSNNEKSPFRYLYVKQKIEMVLAPWN